MGAKQHPVFNRPDCVVEGWYWAFRSSELKRGEVKPLNLLGRELAVFRGEDGKVVALDAYCPHMGAHLAEGRVEGNGLRCFFHHWKFDERGACVDVPCLEKPPRAGNRSHPVAEHYGMIWIYTGSEAAPRLPIVPELDGEEADVMLGSTFVKNCHPNVVLINAIDAQHFYSVHNIPNILEFETVVDDASTITLRNKRAMPGDAWYSRFIRRFYRGPLTYSMTYYNGSTGTVSLGPDFMHFHIMFALRTRKDGVTEGQTILVTKRRKGISGALFNRVVLELTNVVGSYFAKGDTKVFSTIKFEFKTPIKNDHAIIDFIQHLDRQKTVDWTETSESATELARENADSAAPKPRRLRVTAGA